jgi:hypothetical protein
MASDGGKVAKRSFIASVPELVVHRRRVLGVEGEDVADDDGGSLVSIL